MHYNEVICVDFLTKLFEEEKSYSALNSARCSLSTFLVKPCGTTIGNCIIVKRFMKGVFELRPSLPRYAFIWDVSVVLDFLSNFHPNEELPLSVLTHKCVMLLALASMQRVQTLHSIEVDNIFFMHDMISIPIYKLLKQFNVRRNKLVISLKYFNQDPAICAALTLSLYFKNFFSAQ